MRVFRIASLAVCVWTLSAFADPLTITYTSSGTGSVGLTSFTDASFTITELLDTTNIQTFTGGFFIDDDSASIAISGVGTFDFTTATRSFVNNAADIEGFSRATVTGSDLLYSADEPVFGTWDMTTSLGPFTGGGELLQWTTLPQIDTDGGTLLFDNANPTVTFQAFAGTPAPEPASLILVGLGLVGLGLVACAGGRISRLTRSRH